MSTGVSCGTVIERKKTRVYSRSRLFSTQNTLNGTTVTHSSGASYWFVCLHSHWIELLQHPAKVVRIVVPLLPSSQGRIFGRVGSWSLVSGHRRYRAVDVRPTGFTAVMECFCEENDNGCKAMTDIHILIDTYLFTYCFHTAIIMHKCQKNSENVRENSKSFPFNVWMRKQLLSICSAIAQKF